jgi:hypothetical protein
MIPSDEVHQKSSVVGDGWMASGSVYHPRRGVYGEFPYPPAEGWVLAQIWFADEDGVAGWLDASSDGQGESLEDAMYAPRGVLVFGEQVEAVENKPLQFNTKGMSLALWGAQVRDGEISEMGTRVFANFNEGAADYGVSVVRQENPWKVERIVTDSGVLGMKVLREGKADCVVYFNPHQSAASVVARSSGLLLGPDGRRSVITVGEAFSLQPFEAIKLGVINK